ncbi:helix-turn-helix transcriptional regulator [Paenibacillus illinoisensis]|uniref:helix-turn-helix domain-containing protein n=1 Tax=Paenibacillus illinoisensis TaxID=59845 RepID=UPI003CF1A598
MEETDIERYRLKRLSKRIKSKEVASYVGVHITTISHFENRGYPMSKEKIEKYREYIDDYEGSELA